MGALRFRDALLGAISLLLIVFSVILLLVASFGGQNHPLGKCFLSFSFFFRRRSSAPCIPYFLEIKLYRTQRALLVAIVLLVHTTCWPWLDLYLPTGCTSTIFCDLVRVLKRRPNS